MSRRAGPAAQATPWAPPTSCRCFTWGQGGGGRARAGVAGAGESLKPYTSMSSLFFCWYTCSFWGVLVEHGGLRLRVVLEQLHVGQHCGHRGTALGRRRADCSPPTQRPAGGLGAVCGGRHAGPGCRPHVHEASRRGGGMGWGGGQALREPLPFLRP